MSEQVYNSQEVVESPTTPPVSAKEAGGGAGLHISHEAQTDKTEATRASAEEAVDATKSGKMFAGEGVFRDKVKGIISGGLGGKEIKSDENTSGASGVGGVSAPVPKIEIQAPAQVLPAAKRTLYSANVGDARAVLSSVMQFEPSYCSTTDILCSFQSRRAGNPLDV